MRNNENYITVKLTKHIQEKIAGFDCGNNYLSSFILSHDAIDSSFGTTYVWLTDNDNVIGYYNISTGHVETISNNLTIRLGGSVYINCFAVDKEYQKSKYDEMAYVSDILLADCFERINYIRDNHIGFSFVTLSSTSEGHYLYERNGFSEIDEDNMRIAANKGEKTCTSMYFPLDYE